MRQKPCVLRKVQVIQIKKLARTDCITHHKSAILIVDYMGFTIFFPGFGHAFLFYRLIGFCNAGVNVSDMLAELDRQACLQ